MAQEIAEIPDAVQRLIDISMGSCITFGQSLRADPPRAFVTCARGTSDQAALYFKYLVESHAGIPVASLGPSIASIYGVKLQARDMVCLAVSQSGGSPDLLALQRAAALGGARTLALLNTPNSPVGEDAQHVVDLCAGHERAVAATKSFICSLVAVAGVVGGLTDDMGIVDGIQALPDALDRAWTIGDADALVSIAAAPSILVLSRGPGLAAAGEAALKLKETCQRHAEAYSAAEVMHGPAVLSARGVAALAFVPSDAGRASVLDACTALHEAGAPTMRIAEAGPAELIVPAATHTVLTSIIQITAFYRLVEALSRRIGLNPDQPPGLTKITKTL